MSNYNTLKTADTINTVSIVDGAITTSKLGASVTTLIGSGGGPKATAITYPGNDLAADPAGGQTITLTGTGFVAGCSVFVGTVQASVVTVVSATSVTFTAPALAAATYTLYLVNPDGGTATIVPGISYSGTPTWSTSAGTLGSVYEYAAISNTVAATGDGSIVYSVFSGTLPTGSSLNTSTGVISGTSPASAGATTYTFVIRATDAQLQDSDRSFSITVNTDVVTWTTPADNSTTTLGKDVASSTTLLATSAAGNAITYTANALPTGLSIVGATVTGTPTVTASTTSTFTATAATTNRTATRTINWTVSVASDTYFPYTTLLLSGAAATETFIADASTNNFALTIVNDTKPNNFNPYTPGYYSNYFDGSGDYLTMTSNASLGFGTDLYTVECWVYATAAPAFSVLFAVGAGGLQLALESSAGYIAIAQEGIGWLTSSTTLLPLNVWNHVAVSRAAAGLTKIFLNGTQIASGTNTTNFLPGTYANINLNANNPAKITGYISNVRAVKGVAVYTANFTPPTAPLTATQSANTNGNPSADITGSATSLLTCQSNRFIDNSTNSFAVTAVDNTKISSTTPFVPNTAYAEYGSTYFDGTGDQLTVASPNQPTNFGTGDFTVECWIYFNIVPANTAAIISNYSNFYLNNRANGTIALTDATVVYALTASTLTAGNWFHIAVVRNAGSSKIYINGLGGTAVACTVNFNSTNTAYIGGDPNGTINGYIANLRVVKGVAVYTANFTVPTAPLTATQSANTNGNPSAAITGTATSLLTCQTNQPASNSMFLDSSTNALAVTRAGNVSAGTFSPYGANWSNYFSSANYISAASNAAFGFGTGDFTVEAWVYPNAAYTTYNYIWATGVTTGLVFYVLGGVLYVRTWYGSDLLASSTAPAINTWTHVAATRSGTTLRIFVNGVQTGTTTNSTNFPTGPGIVGNDGSNAAPWLGYISNLRVVKGTAVYTTTFTPSTTPLTAIANTSLLTCQSNSLVDNSANAFTITKTGDVAVQRFSPFNPQTQTPITHSAYFDGTGDYLTTPITSSGPLDLGSGNWTVEAWVMYTGASLTGGYRNFLTFCNNSGLPYIQFGTKTGTGYVFAEEGTQSAVPWTVAGTTLLTSNVWHHIATVRNSNNIYLYLDGILQGSVAYSSAHQTFAKVQIGSITYNGNVIQDWTGYISNARIVKGTAVYTAAFTPPTAPLTATQAAGTNIAAITGTQTSLLTLQSPTFADNSTNNFILTAFDNAKPRTINPFGFTNATAAYSAATYGASAYFDGNADYLSSSGSTAFTMGTSAFTVEYWIYQTVNTAAYQQHCGSSISSNGFGFGTNSTLGLYMTTYSAGYSASASILLNCWNHIVWTRDGSNFIRAFLNGVLCYGPTSIATNITETNFGIGSSYNGSYPTTGYISNLRVVKGTALYTSNFVPPVAPLTAITNTSLLLNMNSAGIYDSASGNNLETVADAKILATHTPYAGSYYSNFFDGSGDYLSFPSSSAFNISGNFTIEGWYNFTAFPASGSNDNLWNFSGATTFNPYLYLWSDGTLVLRTAQTGGTVFTVTHNFSLGAWYHIAVVKSGATFTLYLNGVSSGTGTSSAIVSENKSLVIGEGSSYGLQGYLSNFRVVNGTAVYTGNTFTVPTTPLTAITNTSLLTCQSNRFIDNSTNAFAITKYDNTSVQSFNPFQRNSGTSLYFDGTGDYLSMPSSPNLNIGTSDFTIELWFYIPGGITSPLAIIGNGNAGSIDNAYWTLEGVAGGNIGFFAANSATQYFATTTQPWTAGWAHIAVSRSGNNSRLFVNGVQQGSTYTTNNSFAAGGNLYIGTSPYSVSARAMPLGYINDVRITRGYARYTSTFTPPTTAFITK